MRIYTSAYLAQCYVTSFQLRYNIFIQEELMLLKMSLSSATSLVLLLSFFLIACFPSPITSFDIANILAQNPSFSTFNNYLAQTQLVPQINSRQTITVLAVDNAAMSSISGKSMDTIRKVLSIHVILDYYDMNKLHNLNSKSVQVTTLYQTTGQASNQDGFLNLTHMNNGLFSFASSSPQSNGAANLINSIASEPYNLSVIQVSSLIIPSTLSISPAHPNPPSPSPNSNHSNSPSPSSSHHDQNSSSPSPSPSPSTSHPPSPVPVKSPLPVVSPVPVGVPVASPTVPPNAGTPVASPPGPNSPATAPAPDGDGKSGAPTSNRINVAFLILLTFLGALHIHILPC